jgi:hypothetical protein
MQEKLFTDLEEFLQTFRCVGSFSQDRKEANSIIIPGQFMYQDPDRNRNCLDPH